MAVTTAPEGTCNEHVQRSGSVLRKIVKKSYPQKVIQGESISDISVCLSTAINNMYGKQQSPSQNVRVLHATQRRNYLVSAAQSQMKYVELDRLTQQIESISQSIQLKQCNLLTCNCVVKDG